MIIALKVVSLYSFMLSLQHQASCAKIGSYIALCLIYYYVLRLTVSKDNLDWISMHRIAVFIDYYVASNHTAIYIYYIYILDGLNNYVVFFTIESVTGR